MTDLSRLLLWIMRAGLWFSAACFAVFFCLEIWKKFFSGNPGEITRADYVFLAILVVLFAAALLLARSMTRELKK